MGAEKTSLDNYVRTKPPAPQGEPFMDQSKSGKLQRAANDANAKGDMQSEGGPQEESARLPESLAR